MQNKLWKWILIPGLIYMLLFLAGIYLFWISSNQAVEFVLQETGIRAWLESMKTGWLNFFVIVGHIIIFLVLLLFYFSFFKFLFLIIGSPLFAYLSEKTESIIEHKDFPFSWKQLMKDMIRGVYIASRNMIWQLVYLLSIFLLAFIPLFGWLAPLIAFMIECYYFGFSMLDYTSERKRLSAAESINFIGRHKGLAIGNGMIFFLLHLIPLLGWLLAPSYAVIAATLSLKKLENSTSIPHYIPPHHE